MKTANCKTKNCRGGYTILELLFYISFFATLSLVVIDAMIVMTKSFRETSLQGEFVQAGTIMERMSREIRQAYGINSISANDLKLNSTDSLGANKTVEFVLSSGNVQLIENNVTTGNLNTPNIVVTALTFTQITTAKGKAVQIVLSFKSNNDRYSRVQDLNDTIVLRGIY